MLKNLDRLVTTNCLNQQLKLQVCAVLLTVPELCLSELTDLMRCDKKMSLILYNGQFFAVFFESFCLFDRFLEKKTNMKIHLDIFLYSVYRYKKGHQLLV